MSFTLILVALAVITFAVHYLFFRKKQNLPPGPLALPLLGNVLSIGRTPHIAFIKWAEKYGPIFRCKLGTTLTIVLDDPALIREAFNHPLLSGRPDNKAFNITAGGKHGILSSDGEEWQEQRRFTLRHLRDFGFGRQSMDSLILEEVNEIIAWMKSEEGQPISVNRKFGLSVLNSLWMLLTGHRFSHDDPELTKIMDESMRIINELMENGVTLFVPELAEWFPNISGWNKLLKGVEPLLKFFEDDVKDHEDNPNPDENNPRDLIDVYMNEIKKTTDPKSSFYGKGGRKSLVAVVSDLHGAGSETTSTTLVWAILYLSSYPDIQKKLQQVIDDVIGKSRMPCLADKSKMPYTEAVIMEVLRISSLAPIGIMHTAMEDVEFHGYTIPKNAMIMGNLYSVHMNPKIWGDPEVFRPERFLNTDRTIKRHHEAFMPFATGRRVCLGEVLARDVLFLFLTGIFQRFDIKLNPTEPKPDFEAEVGILLSPKPFKVIMNDRLST